jgi:hypothetical protein
MARLRRANANECRRCDCYCDRVIEPASCVSIGCPSLYLFDDPLSGRRYMGCLHKVFDCEIDVELFAAAEQTRGGFGAVKLTGQPRAVCDFVVEQAYGAQDDCVNRRFWDWPDAGADAVRAFDLRNGL